MQQILEILRREHKKIKNILSGVKSYAGRGYAGSRKAINKLLSLKTMWNKHEEKEKEVIKELKSNGLAPPEQLGEFDNQHRELKGHWKVIDMAISSKNDETMRVALDTDGLMLVDKFEKHMGMEDNFLDFVNKVNIYS